MAKNKAKPGDDDADAPKEKDMATSFSFDDLEPVGYLSSGISSVDSMFGNASGDPSLAMGVARGRMVEVYGPNKSAKSEMAQQFIRQAVQDPNAVVAYFDQEWSADPKKIGITNEEQRSRVKIYRADNLEQFYARCYFDLLALRAEHKKRNGGKVDKDSKYLVIVLDSMAAIKSKAEVDKSLGDVVMMAQARLNSEEMPKLRRWMGMTGSILIWVNQTRTKPGPVPVETCPGGDAPTFYADYRVRMRYQGDLWFKSGRTAPTSKTGKVRPDGFVTVAKWIKNKIAPPMGEIDLAVWFKKPIGEAASGLSEMWSVFLYLHANKKLKSAGGRFKVVGAPEVEAFERPTWPEVFSEHKLRLLAIHSALIDDCGEEVAADED